MFQSLLGVQSLVGVVGAELGDEIDTATGGLLHEGRDATAGSVGKAELHVARLAAGGWGFSEWGKKEGEKYNLLERGETHNFLSFLSVSLDGVPTMLCILDTWSSSLEPGNSGRRLYQNNMKHKLAV